MAKTKKPRSNKPKRPPRQLTEAVDLDFQEVEEGEEDKEQEPVREKLFTWKGKEYFMEAPDATVMLDLFEAAAERGDMAAMGVMLKRAIGEENYRVLKSIPDLTTDELNKVASRAMDFAMSQMDEALGN